MQTLIFGESAVRAAVTAHTSATSLSAGRTRCRAPLLSSGAASQLGRHGEVPAHAGPAGAGGNDSPLHESHIVRNVKIDRAGIA